MAFFTFFGANLLKKTITLISNCLYNDEMVLESIYANTQVSSSSYNIIVCHKNAVKSAFFTFFRGLSLTYHNISLKTTRIWIFGPETHISKYIVVVKSD